MKNIKRKGLKKNYRVSDFSMFSELPKTKRSFALPRNIKNALLAMFAVVMVLSLCFSMSSFNNLNKAQAATETITISSENWTCADKVTITNSQFVFSMSGGGNKGTITSNNEYTNVESIQLTISGTVSNLQLDVTVGGVNVASYAKGKITTGTFTINCSTTQTGVIVFSFSTNGGGASNLKVTAVSITTGGGEPTEPFTITYNTNGGVLGNGYTQVTQGAVYTQTSTSSVTLPSDITLSGYHFGGWYDNSSFTGDAVTSLSETDEVWAKWTSTVSFDVNNGNAVSSQTVTKGQSITLPSATRNSTQSIEYTFAGWYDDDDFTNLIGSAGASYTPTGDVTLHAKWTETAVAQKYTITFDKNEFNGAATESTQKTRVSGSVPTLQNVSGEQQIPSCNLTRQNYVLSGWNTAADGSGTSYAVTGTINVTSSITLYARWTPNKVADLEQDNWSAYANHTDAGVFTPASSEKNICWDDLYTTKGTGDFSSATILVDNDKYTLYALSGTYVDKTHRLATEPMIVIPKSSTGFSIVFKDGVLEQWTAVINVYGTTYSTNTGITFKKGNETIGDSTLITSRFNTSGLFDDDTTDFSNSTYATTKVSSIAIGEDAIYSIANDTGANVFISAIDVVFTDATNTTITYNTNGGSISAEGITEVEENEQYTQTSKKGEPTTLAQPTYNAYEFAGWYTDSALTNFYGGAGAVITPTTGAITLYAKWRIPYTVTFDAQGGTVSPSSVTVYYAEKLEEMPTPQRDGYRFLGWYQSNDNSMNKDEFFIDIDTITKDITLYALWFDETEGVKQDDIVAYINSLIDDTDLDTLDQGAWNTESWRGYFNYVNGVFLNSLVNLSYNTTDAVQQEKYRTFVVDYLARYINSKGEIVTYGRSSGNAGNSPNPDSASLFNKSNNNSEYIARLDFLQTVRVLFDAYEFSRDEKFLKAIEWALTEFANDESVRVDGLLNPSHSPSTLNQIWLDGLYMYAPLYARYLKAGGSKTLGTTGYQFTAENLIEQYTVIVENMRDDETGLYYHAYSSDKAAEWADPQTGASETFWGRGLGWYTMSLVDVLDYFPENVTISETFKGETYTDGRAYLMAVLTDLLNSILEVQDPTSKMFYQVLNQETVKLADNYLETSGSSMFAYALMKAGKCGYIDSSLNPSNIDYEARGREVFEGIYAHSVKIDNNGKVNVYDIVDATSLNASNENSDSPEEYVKNSIKSNESKGVSPFMLAFMEYMNEDVIYPPTPGLSESQVILVTNNGVVNNGLSFIVAEEGDLLLDILPKAEGELTISRAGYTFAGWYLDEEFEEPVSANQEFSETITVYAKWIKNLENFTITFNTNGGVLGNGYTQVQAGEKYTYTGNTEFTLPGDITLEGYHFGGWYSNSGFTGDAVTELSQSGEVWAKWTSTVSFDANGGSTAPTSQSIIKGQSTNLSQVTPPTAPSGKAFAGWSLERDGSILNNTYTPTGDVTLYAVWDDVEEIIVSFTGSNTAINSISGDQGSTITLPTPTNASKDYNLLGWYNGETRVGGAGQAYTLTGSVTLTAKWAQTSNEWHAFGYTGTPSSVVYNGMKWFNYNTDASWRTGLTATDNYYTIYESSDVVFKASNDNGTTDTGHPLTKGMVKLNTGSPSKANITINNPSNVTAVTITLYAVAFGDGKLYYGTAPGSNNVTSTIDNAISDATYFANGSTLTPSVVTIEFDSETLPDNGIIPLLTETKNIYLTGFKVEITRSNNVTITYHTTKGATFPSTATVERVSSENQAEVTYNSSNVIAPAGYQFSHWNTQEDGSGVNYEVGSVVTEDIELYTIWNPINYTINYNLGDGSWKNNFTPTTSYNIESNTITLPTAENITAPQGYNFAGWLDASQNQKTEIQKGSTGNVTLTAQWTPITPASFTITFNTNGGVLGNGYTQVTQGAVYTQTSTSSVTLPGNITLSGYHFGGWYSNSSFTGDAVTELSQAGEVWAKWYTTITFNANGGSFTGANPTQNVIKGNQVNFNAIEVPSYQGKAFVGWTLENDDQVLNSYTPTADITLYALWETAVVSDTVCIDVNEAFTTSVSSTSTMYLYNNSNDVTNYSTTAPSCDNYVGIVREDSGQMKSQRYDDQKVFKDNAGSSIYVYQSNNTKENIVINFKLAQNAIATIYFTDVNSAGGTRNYDYTENGVTTSGNAVKVVNKIGDNKFDVDDSAFKNIVDNNCSYEMMVIKHNVSDGGSLTINDTVGKLGIFRIYLDFVSGEQTETKYIEYTTTNEHFTGSLPQTQPVEKDGTVTIANAISCSGYVFMGWLSGDNLIEPGAQYAYDDLPSGTVTLQASWAYEISAITGKNTPSIKQSAIQSEQGVVTSSNLLLVSHLSVSGTRFANSLTVGVTWDLENAVNESSQVIDLSDIENCVPGIYTITGVLNDLPSNYAYAPELLNNSGKATIETTVTIIESIQNQVAFSTGFGQNEITTSSWVDGLTEADGNYVLQASEGVTIETINQKASANISIPKYVMLGYTSDEITADNFESESAIKVTLSSYNTMSLFIRASSAPGQSSTIYLLDQNGNKLADRTIIGGNNYTDSIVDVSYSSTNSTNAQTSYYIVATDNVCYLTAITAVIENQVEDGVGYNVTYNVNGGAGTAPQDGFEYVSGSQVLVKDALNVLPQENSHTYFAGWNTKSDGSGVTYSKNDVITITSSDVTLFAIWQKYSQYTIDFYMGGAQDIADVTIYADQQIGEVLPDDPEMTDYIFEGWYYDANFSAQVNTADYVTGNITLYANWSYDGEEKINVLVNEIHRNVLQGTLELDITAELPKAINVINASSSQAINDVFANITGWSVAANQTYNGSSVGETYTFYGVIGSLSNSSYKLDSRQDKTVDASGNATSVNAVVCLVTIVASSQTKVYSAEYRAYTYTTNADGSITYNNDSDTYGKQWTSYYNKVGSYHIVGRNGDITIGADTTTEPNEDNLNVSTLASCDSSNNQVSPIIKAARKSDKVIAINVPEGAFTTKITVYAVRYRSATSRDGSSQASPKISITDPTGCSTSSSTIDEHSYTESENGTSFVDFHAFTPNATTVTCQGGGVFYINTLEGTESNTANVYITGVKVEVTLLASEPYRTITYHAQNGTNENYSVDYLLSNGADDADDAILELNKFVYDGHVFKGWALSEDADEPDFENGSSINLQGEKFPSGTGNVDLYALWSTPKNITYYRNLSESDDTFFITYYPHGATISENVFIPDNKVFTGWNTERDGSGTTYQPNEMIEEVKFVSSFNLYAQWIEGVDVVTEWSAYSYSTIDTEMIYNNRSHTFGKAWDDYYSNGLLAKNGNITVVAQNISASDDDFTKPMLVMGENSVITVTIPVSELGNNLFDFKVYVYAVSSDGNGVLEVNGSNHTISRRLNSSISFAQFMPNTIVITESNVSDGTFTIEYGSGNVYITGIRLDVVVASTEIDGSVTYHSNSENAQSNVAYYLEGGVLSSINFFSNDGHDFVGWSTDPDGEQAETAYNYGKLISSTTMLYGVWEPGEYDVNFFVYDFYNDKWDSVFIEQQKRVLLGGTIDEDWLDIVIHEYDIDGITYILDGWYTDKSCTNKWIFSNAITYSMVGADGTISFYARYIEKVDNRTKVEPHELDTIQKELAGVISALEGLQTVTQDSLSLPSTVTVSSEDGTISFTASISWVLTTAVNDLQIGENVFTGAVMLTDKQYESYYFGDFDKTATIECTINLTNRIILFDNGNPVVNAQTEYPIDTALETILSNVTVSGFYALMGTRQTINFENLDWICEGFDSAIGGNYTFTTTITAPKGYVFRKYNNGTATNDTITSLDISFTITLVDSTTATAVAGFVRDESNKSNSWRTDLTLSSNQYLIHENGGIRVTANSSNTSVDSNDLASYIKLNKGTDSISIYVPAGIETVTIYVEACFYDAGKAGSLHLRYNSSSVQSLNLSGTSVDNVHASTTWTLTKNVNEARTWTLYSGSTGNSSTTNNAYIRRLLVTAENVSTTRGNIADVSYKKNDQSSFESFEDQLSPYIKGAIVCVPQYNEETMGAMPVGYEFAGWSYQALSANADFVYGDAFKVASDTTLYLAQRPATRKVVFNKNDGSSAVYEVTIGKGDSFVTARNTLATQNPSFATRVGYSLDNWYQDQACTVVFNDASIDENVTVYAKWTPKTYTISFASGNVNNIDLAINNQTIEYGEKISQPDNASVTNENYAFMGKWYLDPACTKEWSFGLAVNENTITDIDSLSTITLYAKWGAQVNYTINITGDVTPAIAGKTVLEIGSTVTQQDLVGGLSLTGYTFNGWALSSDATVAFESFVIERNTEVFGVWSINKYTVTYTSPAISVDGQNVQIQIKFGGVSSNSFTLSGENAVPYNSALDLPQITAEGYVILGWYQTFNNGEFSNEWAFSNTNNPHKVKDNIVLYAKLGVVVNYTQNVTDDSAFASQSFAIGETVKVPVNEPILSRHKFVGWFFDENESNAFEQFVVSPTNLEAILEYGSYDVQTATINIVACFVAQNDTYTIIFQTNGLLDVDNMPQDIAGIVYNGDATIPSLVPSHTFASFNSWNTRADGKGEKYDPSDVVLGIQDNIVLFAIWEIEINEFEDLGSIAGSTSDQLYTILPNYVTGYLKENGEILYTASDVFSIVWSTITNSSGQTTDINVGDILEAGTYTITGNVSSVSGFTFSDDLDTEIQVTLIITSEDTNWVISSIESIESKEVSQNSDERLTTVIATVYPEGNESALSKKALEVVWNSQIDSTVVGTHYVEGVCEIPEGYSLAQGVSKDVYAKIIVKDANGLTDPYVYKMYQDGELPYNPQAPSGFTFICWTRNGAEVLGGAVEGSGQERVSATKGEWLAVYAKLEMVGTSIRIAGDYTGLRFMANLIFYNNRFVRELTAYNDATSSALINVSMTMSFGDDGSSTIIGGHNFRNIVVNDNVVTFNGVVTEIDNHKSTVFTPTALVRLGSSTLSILQLTGTGKSASEVATQVQGLDVYQTYSAEQKAIIDSYIE